MESVIDFLESNTANQSVYVRFENDRRRYCLRYDGRNYNVQKGGEKVVFKNESDIERITKHLNR